MTAKDSEPIRYETKINAAAAMAFH
jgi:hypothetical protein